MKKTLSKINRRKTVHFIAVFLLFWTPVVIFAKLAGEIIEKETPGYDTAILRWVHGFESSQLDAIFLAFTTIGGVVSILILSLLFFVGLVYKKKYSNGLFVALSVGGAGVANHFLKLLFHRDRPSIWHSSVIEHSFSFPSGHAMLSSALVLTIIVLLWRTKWRYLSLVIGLIITVGVGASRLYFGVHYPTDIIAGWCVSAGWVIAMTLLIVDRTGDKRHGLN